MKPPLLALLVLAACDPGSEEGADTDVVPTDTDVADTDETDEADDTDTDTDPPARSIHDLAPGDLVLTELQLASVSVHDPDGPYGDTRHATWVEIRNVGDVAVDLGGMQVTVGASSAVLRSGPILPAGEYAVLSAGCGLDCVSAVPGAIDVGAPALFDGQPFDEPYTWPTVAIGDGRGLVLDTVDLGPMRLGGRQATWPGYSLQLVGDEDATANDVESAWCMSDVPFAPGIHGTPGARATSCLPTPTCDDLALTIQALAVPGPGRTCSQVDTAAADAPLYGIPGLQLVIEADLGGATLVEPGRYVDTSGLVRLDLGVRIDDRCDDLVSYRDFVEMYLWSWSTTSATVEVTIPVDPPDPWYLGDVVLRDLVLQDAQGRACALPDVTSRGWFNWSPHW